MGLQQSKEDAEPVLKMLRQISLPVYTNAKSKLKDLSLNQCKMQVSKYELLLILQMNAKCVKTISQFICGSLNPTDIDLNSLFVLLTLTNQNLKTDTKIEEIINFVCFDIDLEDNKPANTATGTVTIDEMKYLYQLGYQFLNRVSDLDLSGKHYFRAEQDENGICGSLAEQNMVNSIFDKGQEANDRALVVQKLKKSADILKFMAIFSDGKIVSDEQLNAMNDTINNSGKMDGSMNDDMGSIVEGGTVKSYPVVDGESMKKSDHIKEYQNEGNKHQSASFKANPAAGNAERQKNNDSQFSKGSKHKNENIASNNQSQVSKQQHRVKILSSQAVSQAGTTQQGKSSMKNHHCNEGQSPYSLVKMSKRILELRNENMEVINIYEQDENMNKMSNNIQYIMDKQLDFYSQRQLMCCMNTLFGYRKSLEIQQGKGTVQLSQMLHPKKLADRDANMSEQEFYLIQHMQVRRTLRNNLDEYLQQNRAFLKYQIASANAKMMHFYSRDNCRGQKRALEQKKFRLLGQIQTLRAIYSTFVESKSDLEFLKGERLYQNVYLQLNNMYKCDLTAEFLVQFMNIKSKKRESYQFINFLNGAIKILDKVTQLESINVVPNNSGIPTLYMDAKQLLADKLQSQTQIKHVDILKAHKSMKIKLLNYFIYLGKLKALYKIHQSTSLPVDSIHNMFTDQIKKLQIKLQKVDSDLVQFIQNQQIKQNIYSSYFSSCGSMSVIKCGIKGLDFNHVFDYFAMAIIKQRTYEGIWVQIDAKNQKDKTQYEQENEKPVIGKDKVPQCPTRLDSDQLSYLMKLQKMKYMDKFFNGGNQNDSVDSAINFAKYTDELTEMLTSSNKIATKFGNYNNLDILEKARNNNYSTQEYTQSTIRSNLQGLYQNLGLNDVFNNLIHFYDNSSLRKKEFYLDHSSATQKKQLANQLKTLKEFDQHDNFFFDFVPIVEAGEGKGIQKDQDKLDNEFISYVESFSTSYKLIYQDESRKATYKEKKLAYKNTSDYIEHLMAFPENEFEEKFLSQRENIYELGMKVLFMTNKKGFLNLFNLKYLSLPIEHSIQHNYWAYQVIKMHIKESLKSKISQDVTQIAFQNDIIINQSSGIMDEQRESRQDLINITQGSAGNISKSQLGRINTGFKDIFKIMNNTESFDRKGKQSVFKPLITQLEHQINVINTQVTIYQDTVNQWTDHEKDMSKIRSYFLKKIDEYINEENLQKLYQEYEVSFNQYNSIQNICKQIDQLMAGSTQYLKVLRDTLKKEVTYSELGKKDQVDFITKIIKDITGVQTGLKNKAKILLDQIQKQKDSKQQAVQPPQQMNKRVSENMKKSTSKKSESSSPTKVAKPKGDAFEIELKEMEQKVTTQMLQMVTYQDLLIESRQVPDFKSFKSQLMKKCTLVQYKLQRLELFQKYLKMVCGLVDSTANNLDGQLAQENSQRGAKIINSVMSGNIFDQIDIYHQPPKNESPQVYSQSSFEDSPMGTNRNDTYRSTNRLQQLTQPQRCLNYLSNFLKQVCEQEDIFSSNRILKENYLFFFIQLIQVNHHQNKCFLKQKFNLKYVMEHDINIYEIQNTPVKKYLQSYEKQSFFIKNEIFQMLQISEEQLLISKFFEIISKRGNTNVQSVLNKIDEVFSQANLFDEEKTDFQNAQVKIRRLLDQNLRTFREWLDAEANKKLAQVYESSRAQQEMKLIQSTTALQILVQIYYIKQIQQQEDYMYSLNKQVMPAEKAEKADEK